MATGTVKWFNYKKGYGFVTPDEKGAKDIFIHITAVNSAGISNLQDGQKISYEVESRQGKFSAIDIKID